MVDSKDLPLGKVAVQVAIEDLRILQMVAEWFLDHETAPARLFLIESAQRQIVRRRFILRRRKRKVIHVIGWKLRAAIQKLSEAHRRVRIADVRREEMETL